MNSEMDMTQSPAFGSGVFGGWIEDEDGLPAYRYTMRHDDPAAVWHPLPDPPSTLHWHQLGNDRITANAYNLGMVQAFYGESGPLWLNRYEPARNAHAGGFGWLIAGETVLADRDDCISEGARWERIFGMGYFRKRLAFEDLVYERRVFAPAGDLPLLVSEVTVTNARTVALEIGLIEYWDVNLMRITNPLMGLRLRDLFRGAMVSLDLRRDRTILAAVPRRVFSPYGGFPSRPTLTDPELPAVFLASLDAHPEAWITRPASLFAHGRPRHAPALAGCGTLDVPPQPRRQAKACLALRLRMRLAPGESRTLRFLYGYAKGQAPEQIVDDAGRAGAGHWGRTAAHWKHTVPALTHLNREAFLGRELVWSYYYVASASLYDAYAGRHHIPQGGNYLYDSGWNGAARDTAAAVQTLAYYRPPAAREMLMFMMRYQDVTGRLYYDLEGYGRRNRLPYRPSDLGLWFLGALCEYCFATRDFAFLDEIVPYYPLHARRQDSVWGHAGKALEHLIHKVGTGTHGHLRVKLSDWNDEMTWLTARDCPLDIALTILRGESVLNTAMACYILPQLRDLAEYRRDHATAAIAADFHARMVRSLNGAWNGNHLVRSYAGLGTVYGDTEIWLEPQVWALLAEGALTPEREHLLVQRIIACLTQPSDLGLLISSTTAESLTTRKGEQESGGTWFALNGPAAVALARFDRDLAWNELIRNTLAWHAHRYPALWYGIWSGPDAWNGPASSRPGQTWYQHTPLMNIGPQMYPIQNTHAHCQTLYALARMAGITPEAAGWTISPRIPRPAYTFACNLFTLEVTPACIGGSVHLPVTADLRLKVQVPASWRSPIVSINGQRIECTFAQDAITFTVHAKADEDVSWKITPEPGETVLKGSQ